MNSLPAFPLTAATAIDLAYLLDFIRNASQGTDLCLKFKPNVRFREFYSG